MCVQNTVFFLMCLKISFSLSSLVYTCQEREANDKLLLLKETLLCNRSFICKDLNNIFDNGTFHKNVIVVHHGFDSAFINRLQGWSDCGVQFSIINGRNINNFPDLTEICSDDRKTIVITLGNESWSVFEDIRSADNCLFQDIKYSDQFNTINQVVSTCYNTVWVIGANNCSGNYGKEAFRVQTVNSSNHNQSFTHSKEKLTFKIATIDYPPFAYELMNGSRHTGKYIGPVFQLVDRLSEKLHFNYEVYPSNDSKYGKEKEDGSWNGLIGQLDGKHVDMVAAALTITMGRNKVVDFSVPFYYEPYGVLIHKPKPTNNIWSASAVFSLTVWFVLLVSTVIAIVYCYIINKFSAVPAINGCNTIVDCIWYFTSSLVNQSGSLEAVSWSARNFLAFWMLFVGAIIAVYSGFLVAMLSTGKTVLPFETLAELALLASQDKYKLCIVDSTAMHDAIKKEITKDYKLLNSTLTKHGEYVKENNNECMHYTLQNIDVAYMAEKSQLDYFQMQNCWTTPMIVLTVSAQSGYLALALQKGSPWTKLLSVEIQEIVDTGLFKGWKDRNAMMINNNSLCEVPVADDFVNAITESLTLKEFGGSFVLLAMGICISTTVLCFETLYHRKRTALKRNSSLKSTSSMITFLS